MTLYRDVGEQARILWRVLHYVRPYTFRFGLMLLCTTVASVTKVGGLVLIKPFGDLILGTFDVDAYVRLPGLTSGAGRRAVEGFASTLQEAPHTALLMLVGLLMGLVAVQAFSHFAAVYLQTYIGGRISVDLKREMVSRLFAQPMAYFQQMGRGFIHRIVDQDSHAAFRTLYVIVNRLIRAPIEGLAVLAIALTIDWKLTLFAGVLLPVVGLTISAFRKRLRQQDADMVRVMGAGSGLLQETLAAPEVVKAYQMEPFFIDRYTQLSKKLFRVMMSLRKSREWMTPIIELTAGAATGAFVFLNGRALIEGRIDMASFLLLYGCLASLLDPIRKVGKGYTEVYLLFMSLRRVFDLLATTPVHERDTPAVTLDTVAGRIEFRDVTFAYQPNRPALRGLSFHIAAGERVALVGPSGAGKSTVARLLLRLYDPQSGAILLDGQDIRDVTEESLRRHMGLVTQDTVLFTGTVRDNITAGRQDVSGEQVSRAAHAAQAHDFILQLPQGYDTPLGDYGSSLSGGQAQRIALARALFRDTPVLVLDEATSALDAVVEDEIQVALDHLTEGRTCIIIAHRLSTVFTADRVILIHQGRVAGEGSHETLMRGNPTYRDLFERQLLPLVDDVGASPDAREAEAR